MNSKNVGTVILIRPGIDNIVFSQPNPPIGLGYLSGFLEKNGFKTYILDLSVKKVSFDVLVQFIQKKKPILIGITALTAYYNSMRKLSINLKGIIKDIPIVLGGVHVSALPIEAITECKADFVVIGEGEETLLELANAINEGKHDYSKIKGLCYRDGNKIKINETRKLIEDIDSIPLPSWNKINPNKYPKEPHGFILKYLKVAPILSTRGCPFKCTYCASCRFWHQRIRFRTPRLVVDEIEYLIKNFNTKEVHFWDDNLTLKREHIVGICNEIIRRGIKIALCTPNGIKVDTLDENLLKLMKRAGFYKLTFAVESGSNRLLKESHKKSNLVKIMKNAFIAKSLGYILSSFNIFGFPGETEETIKKTLNLARALPFDFSIFFLMKPLPGSQLFEEWRNSMDLHGYKWDKINYFTADVNLSMIDSKILEKWQRKAFHYYYLNIKGITRYVYLRLIKFGHLPQYKFFFWRIVYLLLGFEKFMQ